MCKEKQILTYLKTLKKEINRLEHMEHEDPLMEISLVTKQEILEEAIKIIGEYKLRQKKDLKMKKVSWWLETGFAQGNREGIFEVDINTTGTEIEEMAKQEAFNEIDWGFEIIDY